MSWGMIVLRERVLYLQGLIKALTWCAATPLAYNNKDYILYSKAYWPCVIDVFVTDSDRSLSS